MLLLGDRGWGLLLLDGELGDGTALDVLAAAPAPRAAVVVMTGSRDPRFHRALRLANVDKVVEKPFEMSALRALVLKLTSEASGA
jgi:DNA-binding response OmpR family regulator